MPLDPRIALGVESPRFADPLEQFAKAQGARNMITQGQLQQQNLQQGTLALQEQQRQLTEAQKLRELFASEPDIEKALPKVMAINHNTGIAMQKGLLEAKKQRGEMEKTAIETGIKKAERLGSLAGTVTDESTAHQAIATALGEGLITPQHADAIFAQPWNPQTLKTIQGFGAQALSAKDQLQAKLDADKAKREADEAAARLPGIKADADQKVKTNAGTNQIGMTAEDQAQQTGQAITRAEQHRHNLTDESTAKLNAAVAGGRLAQEKLVNGMKYGPGTTDYWVKQLQDNPDSIKEMPPELRSSVGQGFSKATGLPLPTAAGAAAQTQETAARNALDGIDFVTKALENPEVRKQIGPIMGRLSNVEEAVGSAVGLSPEAEKLAQELRTRMRYLVLQEGKAIMGGRLPQQLMGEFEKSSANIKMDPDMLRGALGGAKNNAMSVIDNVDRQRFGGKMRPRSMRSGPGTEDVPVNRKPLSEIFK